MYNWLVFLHVFFGFALMLAHGVHAAAMLAFRSEPDPERSLTFFHIVPEINLVRYLTVLLGVPGVIAAIMTGWWRQGWTWASLGVFIIISFVMYRYGAGCYYIIQDAANHLIEARKTKTNLDSAQREFEAARHSSHPMLVSVVGLVGLAIILWLMRFKHF